MLAVLRGRTEVATEILRRGVNVNAIDNTGETALDYANRQLTTSADSSESLRLELNQLIDQLKKAGGKTKATLNSLAAVTIRPEDPIDD